MAFTSPVSGCGCDVGAASGRNGELTGKFGADITFTAQTSGSEIRVRVPMGSSSCIGTYEVISGSVLGITASSADLRGAAGGSSSGSDGGSGVPIGAIIGGVIAGVVFLVALVTGIYYFSKKSKQSELPSNKDTNLAPPPAVDVAMYANHNDGSVDGEGLEVHTIKTHVGA